MHSFVDRERVSLIPRSLFKVRWRFVYHDSKDKPGCWNDNGRPQDGAKYQTKRGLKTACIDLECRLTGKEYCAVEVPGEDYVATRFKSIARAPGMPKFEGGITLRRLCVGIEFFTRYEKITVDIDGSVESIPLTEEERNFNQFLEHRM